MPLSKKGLIPCEGLHLCCEKHTEKSSVNALVECMLVKHSGMDTGLIEVFAR